MPLRYVFVLIVVYAGFRIGFLGITDPLLGTAYGWESMLFRVAEVADIVGGLALFVAVIHAYLSDRRLFTRLTAIILLFVGLYVLHAARDDLVTKGLLFLHRHEPVEVEIPGTRPRDFALWQQASEPAFNRVPESAEGFADRRGFFDHVFSVRPFAKSVRDSPRRIHRCGARQVTDLADLRGDFQYRFCDLLRRSHTGAAAGDDDACGEELRAAYGFKMRFYEFEHFLEPLLYDRIHFSYRDLRASHGTALHLFCFGKRNLERERDRVGDIGRTHRQDFY